MGMVKMLLLFQLLFQTKATGGTITVEITGIKELSGNVNIALYNRAEGFTQPENAMAGKSVRATANKLHIHLPDIPFGEYAIAVFHDKNGNGKLDTNWLGIPAELYGFSNNARGTFGPPDFSDASFSFNNTFHVVKITVN